MGPIATNLIYVYKKCALEGAPYRHLTKICIKEIYPKESTPLPQDQYFYPRNMHYG